MEKVYYFEYYPSRGDAFKTAVVLTLESLQALRKAHATDDELFDELVRKLETKTKQTIWFISEILTDEPKLISKLKSKKTIGDMTEEGSWAMSLVSMKDAKNKVKEIELDLDEAVVKKAPTSLSKKQLDFYLDEINDILSSGQGDYYIDDWHEKSLKELYKTIPVEHRLAVYSVYLKSLKGPNAMTPLKGEKTFMKQLFSNKIKESVKSKLKESRPSAMSLEEITSIIGEMNNTISGPSEEGKPGVCIVYSFEKEQLDKLCSKYGIEYEIIEKFVDGNGDECLEVREKQLKENKNIMSKKKQIELLEGEIEKLAGKKVKLVESSIECSCKKDKLTEAKKDKEEKEEEEVEVEDTAVAKSDEAALKAATEDASEPILGNIIPASVIKEIDAYVTNTLAEIDKATTQLRAIKKQITSGATASNEDFSTLTDRIAFLVKQLSRIALYSSNTIKAGKFDKTLLDKIFEQKEL